MSEMTWLSPNQAAAFEGISRKQVYQRMKRAGHPLLWRPREDGQLGRLIDARSMTWPAQERWREHVLRNMVKPSVSIEPESGQFLLLPQTEIDSKIAALTLPAWARNVVLRRYRIVDLRLNCNWKAQGYASKAEFDTALAKSNQTSKRSMQRWTLDWKKSEDFLDLAPEFRGPDAGTGSILDADMRAHLIDCWEIRKLTLRQCYTSLRAYLKQKQDSPGCKVDHLYLIPSLATVRRFIRSRSPIDHAARQGPDALKAAAGYMDRTYADLASLERVENDECKLNVFGFDPRRPTDKEGKPITPRYWLLTFYDCRSIYPLVWDLVGGSEFDVRHGIAEEDEIDLLVRLVRDYGLPAAIHSDRGRFRGKTFGGKPLGEVIDEKFACANGILDQLDIRHNMPRVHNPRGTRLERFHRFVADWFRGRPGWVGANTKERKMSRGDADVAQHALWLKGKLPPGEKTPLLTRAQLLVDVNQMMEAWRDHQSKGTDMHGLSPRAVFVHNTPAAGFKRISEEQLALATARHFENETVETGGIITLPDGARYSHPSLILIQGEQREVARLRQDDSFISVLPDQKGEEAIIAPRRVPVGTKDQAALAQQSEMQARIQKLVGSVAPMAADPKRVISGPEWMNERPRKLRNEAPIASEALDAGDSRPAPSLYDLKRITAEEL